MQEITITDIYIYPIKSLGGISLNEAEVQERGLKYDRRWMLVDKENIFVTQRKLHQLALLKTSISGEFIEIGNKDFGFIQIPLHPNSRTQCEVKVWDSTCEALEMQEISNDFFSTFLNKKVKLVYMPDSSRRPVDPNFAFDGEVVSFADGFPILLIGKASLDDLNARLISPVLMNRFRPNIVVSTTIPFDEDTWLDIAIGDSKFKAVKKCSRCVLTTVNQETGEKGSEPLATLSTYRTFNYKVYFGQNLLYVGGGKNIRIGDKVISQKKDLTNH